MLLDCNIQTNVEYTIPLFNEFNKKNYFANFLEFQFHDHFDGLIGNNILINLNPIINYKTRSLIADGATIQIYFIEEKEICTCEKFNDEFSNVFYSKIVRNKIAGKVFSDHLSNADASKLKSLLNSYKAKRQKTKSPFLEHFADTLKSTQKRSIDKSVKCCSRR